MIKKVPQVFLHVICIAFAARAQEDCPGKKLSIQPFVAGFPDRDSLTVSEILAAGKLSTKYPGFEITGFEIGTGGNCLSEEGLYVAWRCDSNHISGEAVKLLKGAGAGRDYVFDHIHLRNKSGQRFCAGQFPVHVSNPLKGSSAKVFVAGHPNAANLKLSELIKAGKLSIDDNSYEISAFVLSTIGGKMPTYVEVKNEGAGFNGEVGKYIAAGIPGQTFFFYRFLIRDKAGNIYSLDQQLKIVVQKE